MADADSEDLLIDTEYNLYVLSQEIDSDARYELPKLREAGPCHLVRSRYARYSNQAPGFSHQRFPKRF